MMHPFVAVDLASDLWGPDIGQEWTRVSIGWIQSEEITLRKKRRLEIIMEQITKQD